MIFNTADNTREKDNTVKMEMFDLDQIQVENKVVVGRISPEETLRRMSIQFSGESNSRGSIRSVEQILKLQQLTSTAEKESS